MKELREMYFSIQMTLFPVLEEEKIEISGKIKEVVELIEAVKLARSRKPQNKWGHTPRSLIRIRAGVR